MASPGERTFPFVFGLTDVVALTVTSPPRAVSGNQANVEGRRTKNLEKVESHNITSAPGIKWHLNLEVPLGFSVKEKFLFSFCN